jgi:hypothetical protein
LQSGNNIVKRLIPTHTLKCACSLWSDPAEREEDAIRTVDALQVMVDFRTQSSFSERVIGISDEPDRNAVLDSHLPGARIGTVMWAGTTYNAGLRVLHVIHGSNLLSRKLHYLGGIH